MLLIVLGILLSVWLVYIVEKARQPPWLKMAFAILLIALAIGFGVQFLLIFLAI